MDYIDIDSEITGYLCGFIVKQYGGIPPNSEIENISNSFLDGIVNYLDNSRAFMMNRYGLDRYDDIPTGDNVTQRDRYEKAAENIAKSAHSTLLMYDDVLLFGESDNSFYYMWYDNDVSDCSITRVSKETFPHLTLDQYIDIVLARHKETFHCWKRDLKQAEPMFVEFKLNGWVKA